MPIRDQYIGAIQHMESWFGRECGDYVILKDATLKHCIGYATYYLYERDTERNYRYRRYWWTLESLLRSYGGYR